jgi:hypothetical protein
MKLQRRPALFQGLIFGPMTLNQSMQDAGEAVAAEQVTLSVTGRLASGTNSQIFSHSLWTNTRRPSAVMTSWSRAAGSKRSRSK